MGQAQLMRTYEEAFARHGLTAAQLLLTHGDIDSLNAAKTLTTLSANCAPSRGLFR